MNCGEGGSPDVKTFKQWPNGHEDLFFDLHPILVEKQWLYEREGFVGAISIF